MEKRRLSENTFRLYSGKNCYVTVEMKDYSRESGFTITPAEGMNFHQGIKCNDWTFDGWIEEVQCGTEFVTEWQLGVK